MSKKSKPRYLLFIIPLLVNILIVAGGLALAPTHAQSDISTVAAGNIVMSVGLADNPTPPPAEEWIDEAEKGAEQVSTPPKSTFVVTPTIYLKSREFQPSAFDALDTQSLRQIASEGQDRVHVLVQLDFIPRELAKTELAARGLTLLSYVPDNAWIATLSTADPEAALALPGVAWIGELRVDDKLDPAIIANQWGSWNLAPDGTAAVYVALHKDESLEIGRQLAEAHGARVTGEIIGINLLIVEIPQEQIRALAAEEAVQWIEPAAPPLGEANDGIRNQIGVNTVQAAPYNLDGTGIDVLVYDGGQVENHVDFTGRLIHGDAASVSEHSTHVAGTVGGSGANSVAQGGSALQWRGMAPGADIISYGYQWDSTGILFYSNPGDIETDWAAGQNSYGADIGTASLSSNIYLNYSPTYCYLMGNYGQTSVLMDQIVRGGNSAVGIGDKYIATWAVGNERGSGSSCDTYRTISPPAAAKNPIHVGASNTNNNTMTTFSSWGPTDDGRIKPIVTAGGCQSSGDFGITSTDNNPVNDYTTMCGTSMATPAVAGSIALMLQQYRTTYVTSGNFWPSTAKAILIQTADDLGNPGPDYQWGFGQVRIQQAVDLIIARGFTQANVLQGETDLYTFVVTDTATSAQVSLAWDDYEATLNANPTLINNLDLELVAPSGTIWRPWVLDPANPTNNATRGVDNRNNQEQVQVPTPEVGTWLVRVIGTTVPQGPQDYSLACEGCRAVNAGVCQATVNTPPLLAASSLVGESGDFVLQAPPAEPISAGEQWQRDREQGRSDADQPSNNFTSKEDPAYTPIAALPLDELDRAKADRLNAALREFDVARNAGPDAVIAFADRASDEVRDVISSAVAEAQAQLAASNDLIVPSSPAAPNATRVGVNGACAYDTIQEAINAASNGDTVRVMGDFFTESIDISGKNITIEGGYDATCTTLVPGAISRLDAVTSGSVVDMTDGSVVTLQNLELGWGSSFGAGLDLLGSSQATLDNTDIIHNNGSFGGGIYIGSGSQVTLTNGSRVQYNTGSAGGGAIVYGRLNALDTNSDLANNCATSDGGGAYVNGGTLYLSEADMTGNQAAGATGRGGAILAQAGSVITLTGAAYIGDAGSYANTAYDGGGVYADNSTLNLNSTTTTLSNNAADHYGGGVYLTNNAHLVVNGGRIGSDFTSSTGNDAILGAGIYAITSTVSGSVRLYNNIATTSGGGLYTAASVITLTNSTIGDVGVNRQNQLGAAGHEGVGLFLTNSTQATLSNTVVASNTFQTTSWGYGGGLLVENGSVVTLTSGRVERHAAPSTDGRGAGIYVRDATVTLDNSQVLSNTAAVGGGVRMWSVSTVNTMNDSTFVNNEAFSGEGGAIAALNTPDINVSDATFQNNYASTDGGAIYVGGGTLDFTGGWTLRENTAGGNGGAVAVVGTATANFRAESYSLVYYNRALGGHGGMVYLNNNTTARLYAISGFNMYVYANQASGNGGALYANNGGYFDVYGQVSLDRNRADNGGAIYLSNGSRVWIDDYFQIKPELWDNRADNGSGGAIYASNSPSVQCDGAVFGHEDEGNLASAGDGGAIYLSGSTLDADNCLFAENQATNNGGAIAAYTSTVALRASLTSGALVTSEPASHDGLAPLAPAATACNPMLGLCSAFFENVADSDGNSIGDGGAIYNDDGTFTLKHTALYTNTAYRGGAIYQTGTSANAQVENTLIYSNTVGIALGAGIRTAGGTFSVTHTTIANNINGAGYSQLNTTSEVHNSIAWGNEANGFLGTFVATSCNIDQSGNAGPAVDPQFSNPGTGENYHLLGGSPAINACSTGLSPDLDGVPRPVGSNYDMGAFEYASGIDFTPDNSSNGVPASAVHYVHTLTNSGNRFDTFTMVASSSQGWVVTIEPAPSVMLTAGQSTTVTVTVNIPGGAAVGTVDTTMVSAAPSADPSLTATVTDTTTVIAAPDIDVTPLTLSVTLVPGETAMRTLTIQNNGSATLIWSLAENPASAWLNVNPVSGNIPGAGNVSVNVSFDTTGLAGGVYTTMLQITSNDPDEPQIDVFVTLIVQNYIYLPLVMR